ncbi:hypothetical protein J2S43_001636 [Catenuloplanes nepalensis]|uniref:VWFA domain-containing protein n=1 Tax=Catenuloplanes nepalensis TaxID=587533 RepID=A0ABT9MNX1_9ACTN|nr:vWA domain-containing protein [Catenuloplanes nepalensis]MDP9793124.1 hypothetical protein [Catenuloplanes nepalensis]
MHIGRSVIARWTGAAVAAAIAVTMTGGPVIAAPDGQASLDEVYAALGVDDVPSDYVVMVDVSRSMAGDRYEQLKKSLTGFFAALAPEDTVTLIPFAEGTKADTRPVGRSPGELVAMLPRDADGSYTDIGAALEAAVATLGRPDAPSLATVVLLTDGQHAPGPRSAYPLTEGHNWVKLADRAKKLRKTSLDAYAVPLAGATGAGLLTKVFPGARVLETTSVDRLTTSLAGPKAAARAAKARSLLAAEIDRPVEVTWPDEEIGAGGTVLDVQLRSPMAHVPLVLDRMTVTSGNAALTSTVPDGRVTLPPGGTVTVPVAVTWDAGPRAFAPLKTVRDRATLRLSAEVGSPWSTVLTDDLKLALPTELPPQAPELSLSAQRGSLWYWVSTALLLLCAMLLALHWRRRRLSPMLTGSVRIDGAGAEPRLLPLSGRRSQLSADVTGLPGSGDITAIRPAVSTTEVNLLITYSPDGSAARRETAICRAGETVSVTGTSFTWQTTVPAQRITRSTTSRVKR